jgi:uncharacterized protein YjdB
VVSARYAHPGDVFPADPAVTASAVPSNTEYRPVPSAAWTAGQKVTIGGLDFHYNGAAWAAGAAQAPAPPLTGITIAGGDAQSLSSTTGTLQLTVTPTPAGAVLGTVTWSSGATGKATVSSTGLVTGVAAGTAVVTATAGGLSDTVTITVPAPALTGITISGGDAQSLPSTTGTLQLTPVPVPAGATLGPVSWHSADDTKATVSNTGLVTGVAAGDVVITATSGTFNDTVTITVPAPAAPTGPTAPAQPTLAGISFGQTGYTLPTTTGTLQLDLVPDPANAPIGTATWTSETEGVATVSNTGLVTGVAPGTSKITATVDGHTAETTITVPAPVLTGITIAGGDSQSLSTGGTLQLTVTPTPAGAVLGEVTWSGDGTPSPAATVDANSGLVTGVAAGDAVITATAGGFSDTVTIQVT